MDRRAKRTQIALHAARPALIGANRCRTGTAHTKATLTKVATGKQHPTDVEGSRAIYGDHRI